GAEEYANHVRKLETRGMTMHQVAAAKAYILSDRQDNTRYGGGGPDEREQPRRATDYDDYVDPVNRTYPPEWKEYLDLPHCNYTLADCLGFCIFWIGFKPFTPIRRWDEAELYSYATGVALDYAEVEKGTRRARALIRAYNAILGERMRADDLPAKFFAGIGPIPAMSRDALSKAIDSANKAMGYNVEGIPTREALEEIGLDYVAEELEQRGILSQPVSTPAV
ncbi:MAG: aldehyde ferredoxin oxidoreductase C-terminal domain-containing protein, partial [Dehalococcoidales bacterium]|nr:aldehyde ferredoxin oxidoreductase C-terminal domain-containing protein [Dehalococcoidales bacterium]